MAQNTASADALRAKIDVHRPAIAMAAHNPLAAKLAANAGFDAIWGSGFELSASYAVPDANILSMSTHLEMMRAIGQVQDAPVIADLDTGFGNAVNVAYVVPQYAAAGVAAVVIEDKTFPKDTSLRPGGRQELVPIGEFQGKVAAAKATGGVLVIARTEALIAGRGQEEALRRGAAYAEAGADAVLIHSKEKTPDEILAFCRAWPGRAPLVLVPTSYPQLCIRRCRGARQGRADHLRQSRRPRRRRRDATRLPSHPRRRRHRRRRNRDRLGRGRVRPARRRADARDRENVSALERAVSLRSRRQSRPSP